MLKAILGSGVNKNQQRGSANYAAAKKKHTQNNNTTSALGTQRASALGSKKQPPTARISSLPSIIEPTDNRDSKTHSAKVVKLREPDTAEPSARISQPQKTTSLTTPPRPIESSQDFSQFLDRLKAGEPVTIISHAGTSGKNCFGDVMNNVYIALDLMNRYPHANVFLAVSQESRAVLTKLFSEFNEQAHHLEKGEVGHLDLSDYPYQECLQVLDWDQAPQALERFFAQKDNAAELCDQPYFVIGFKHYDNDMEDPNVHMKICDAPPGETDNRIDRNGAWHYHKDHLTLTQVKQVAPSPKKLNSILQQLVNKSQNTPAQKDQLLKALNTEKERFHLVSSYSRCKLSQDMFLSPLMEEAKKNPDTTYFAVVKFPEHRQLPPNLKVLSPGIMTNKEYSSVLAAADTALVAGYASLNQAMLCSSDGHGKRITHEGVPWIDRAKVVPDSMMGSIGTLDWKADDDVRAVDSQAILGLPTNPKKLLHQSQSQFDLPRMIEELHFEQKIDECEDVHSLRRMASRSDSDRFSSFAKTKLERHESNLSERMETSPSTPSLATTVTSEKSLQSLAARASNDDSSSSEDNYIERAMTTVRFV